MSILAFIAEITKALAWPFVVLIIVLVFRRSVVAAIGRLKSVKQSGVELSFGEELKNTEELASSAGITVFYPLTSLRPDQLSLASTSPNGAVLDAWLRVERLISQLASEVGVSSPPGRLPLVELESRGYLANGLGSIVDRLRQTRNVAVHDVSQDLLESEAVEFLMLTKSVESRLTQEVDRARSARK